jgi:hypothetical protein
MDAAGHASSEMRVARARVGQSRRALEEEKGRIAETVEAGVEQAAQPLLRLKTASDWARSSCARPPLRPARALPQSEGLGPPRLARRH